MGYKSESCTTLDRINWYVGVANKIFMENAPKKTGCKIEMQRVARLSRMEVRTTEPYYPCQNKA